MSITSIKNHSLHGIQRGFQGLRNNATDIAGTATLPQRAPTRDAVRSMVELHQNAQQVAISVQTFKTADRMIGSLIDIEA